MLVVKLEEDVWWKGRLLEKGRYLYIGSYPNWHRVIRHIKREKKVRWHIDFLLSKGEVEAIYLSPSDEKGMALFLQQLLGVVEGFGSSDSPAKGHLFKLE